MGESLIDGLARALAEPMPRRRLLRVAGSLVLAASLPASAHAAPSRVHRRRAAAFTCLPDAGFGGQRCDSKSSCCGRKWGTDTCGCCEPGQSCEPDGSGYARCRSCPTKRKCGDVCCPAGKVCRNPSEQVCCPPDWTYCKASKDRCCKPGDRCCVKKNAAGKAVSAVCCGKFAFCHKGVCLCDNPKVALEGPRHQSCDGTRAQCCPKEGCPDCSCKDCEGAQPATRKCCKPEEICCGSKCCDAGEVDGRVRNRCVQSPRGHVCCPEQRAVATATGEDVCCPAGTLSDELYGCCPPSDPDCCDGVECSALDVCVRGTCVPHGIDVN